MSSRRNSRNNHRIRSNSNGSREVANLGTNLVDVPQVGTRSVGRRSLRGESNSAPGPAASDLIPSVPARRSESGVGRKSKRNAQTEAFEDEDEETSDARSSKSLLKLSKKQLVDLVRKTSGGSPKRRRVQSASSDRDEEDSSSDEGESGAQESESESGEGFFDINKITAAVSLFDDTVAAMQTMASTSVIPTTRNPLTFHDQSSVVSSLSLRPGDIFFLDHNHPERWDDLKDIHFYKFGPSSTVTGFAISSCKTGSPKNGLRVDSGTYTLKPGSKVLKLSATGSLAMAVAGNTSSEKKRMAKHNVFDPYTGKLITNLYETSGITYFLKRTAAIRRLTEVTIFENLVGADTKFTPDSVWEKIVSLGDMCLNGNRAASHLYQFAHFKSSKLEGVKYFRALDKGVWGTEFSFLTFSRELPPDPSSAKATLAENLLRFERFLILCHGDHFEDSTRALRTELTKGSLFHRAWVPAYVQHLIAEKIRLFFYSVMQDQLAEFQARVAGHSLDCPGACVLWFISLLSDLSPSAVDQTYFLHQSASHSSGTSSVKFKSADRSDRASHEKEVKNENKSGICRYHLLFSVGFKSKKGISTECRKGDACQFGHPNLTGMSKQDKVALIRKAAEEGMSSTLAAAAEKCVDL